MGCICLGFGARARCWGGRGQLFLSPHLAAAAKFRLKYTICNIYEYIYFILLSFFFFDGNLRLAIGLEQITFVVFVVVVYCVYGRALPKLFGT